ncbi:hypothetical protein LXL04_004866 [Taraxacum kok-saghyz]
MATVATRGPIRAPKPLLYNGSMADVLSGGSSKGTNAIKRKTPSELRQEQLKHKNVIELTDESPALDPVSTLNANGLTSESMKPSKNPRYIDTRVDELFPSRKNSLRLLKLQSAMEHVKGNVTTDHKLSADKQSEFSCLKDTTTTTKTSKSTQSHITTKKCSISTLRSVMDLASVGDKSSGVSLNMDEAFKGLAACNFPVIPPSHTTESIDGNLNPSKTNFPSEFHIPGSKIPLDFTLKTCMRVTASSSVSWFHRMMSCGTNCLTSQNSNTKALYSWVYPQSSFPPSVISALTLSSKGEGQMDFLTKRQLQWETSFRSLYVMFSKNICNLFYVCTGHFVAMFTNVNGTFNAYVSQSTQSLRSLLKEQVHHLITFIKGILVFLHLLTPLCVLKDISFTMPLCNSKVEQATKEDLFELSEIEKHNLGKTRYTHTLFDVDNTPESLLMFSDKLNVHGLYDFLLNYRFVLPSLNSLDVPLLYSPVSFENAAISAPEVKCKEVRKIDHISAPIMNEGSGSYYSIEIKDAYIPPWIISSVCDAIKSNGNDSFETSFVIEPMSIGLNVGLEGVNDEFGIGNTVVSNELSRGFLKSLKYSDESYLVSLSPV